MPEPGPAGGSAGAGRTTRPPGLGPHLLGRRVVVRRILRGEAGPSGGPAFADTLGVMESWADGVTTVRTESGQVARIAIADIVSGKAVPPRPAVRHRISAEDAETRANVSWPALETEALGSWLLRASGGFSSRANSVLAVGEPDAPFARALEQVQDFYARRSLPAWAQVVVGSDAHRRFQQARWQPARPGEEDTAFQIASVARAVRAARAGLAEQLPAVSTSTTATAMWLRSDARALAFGETARAVLEGPEHVCFATVPDPETPDTPLAAGRSTFADDWVAISNLWVAPEHRGQRLASVVVRALLEWGAERGATTAYLQVRDDNTAALATYARLGFATHHHYRYLTPPVAGS